MAKIRFPTIVMIALIGIFGFQMWNRNRPLPPTSVEWWTNYDLASQYAQTHKKPMLIEFYADWCGACKSLERGTLRDQEIEKWLGEVVPVKVNIDKPENAAVTREFGVTGIPAMHLVDANGKPVAGVLGDVPPDAMLREFKEFVD